MIIFLCPALTQKDLQNKDLVILRGKNAQQRYGSALLLRPTTSTLHVASLSLALAVVPTRVEGHLIGILQRVAGDVRGVHEEVFAAIMRGDETIPLAEVEELNGSLHSHLSCGVSCER